MRRGGQQPPLDRKQRTFNRLLATIDRLRTRLDAETRGFEDALVFHNAHVQPRIAHVAQLRTDVVRAVAPYLDDSRLGKASRKELAALLTEQVDDILASVGTLDDDLLGLFERLHGASLDTLERQGMDAARVEAERMFADMGVDIDLSSFQLGMDEDELAVKMAETLDSLRQQADGVRQRHQRKATRAQKTTETARKAEEIRKSNLGTIYRQLAKVLHPDLEPDPDLRQRKSAVMQELTAAHAAGDLHALLRLELEWLHREETDRVRLTDETLDAYNAILKEQVAGLEAALEMLPYDPRYAGLVHDMAPWGYVVRFDGAAEVERLDGLAAGLVASIERLGTPHALREVRAALQTRRSARGSW